MGEVVRIYPNRDNDNTTVEQVPSHRGEVEKPARQIVPGQFEEKTPQHAVGVIVPVQLPARRGRPLCPEDAGHPRYVVSVVGHATYKTPRAVWDRFWDWAKLAPLREGESHRGLVIERHQQAYVTHQRERGRRVGQALKAVTTPWHTRSKIGPVPVPLVTLAFTAGEISSVAYPSNVLLAHTFGLVNGWVANLAGHLGTVVSPVVLPVAGVAAVAALGHSIKVEHRNRRKALQVRLGAEVGVKEGGELLPAMPLMDCPHPNMVLEATRRNLAIEKLLVKPLSAQPTAWGWEVVVQMRKGTPADIATKTDDLETLFNLRENGVLVQPHRDRRAQATLRLIESDPWADMPDLPDYASVDRSVSDPIWLAQRLDGVAVTSAFNGKQSIILAASGGGKSILMRLIADGLGAAQDVHLWDLDPSGVGQAPQAKLMGKTALTPEDCELGLAQALAIASARTRMLRRLGMGDAWAASPERPLLAIMLDEFPRLSPAAKKMAVALLRIARKAGLVLIFASQDAKKDTLGDSIAGQVAFKAGGPGLIDWQADLLWGAAAKSRGWDPGRYEPATAQDQPNDAGTFYISGTGVPGGDLALPSRTGYMKGAAAEARAIRYVELGRCPKIDAESLKRAGLTEEEVYTHTDADDAEQAQQLAATTEPAEDTETDLSDQAKQFLAACARVYGDDDSEWVPTTAIAVEVGVGELGWPDGEENAKLREMQVAELLKEAKVTSVRKTINGERATRVPRAALLSVAGADIDRDTQTA